MAKKNEVELFTEIMASERMSAFQNYSTTGFSWYNADNPTATWEQLKCNPWVAMAVYWDMEEKNAAIYSGLDTRKNNVLSKPRNILPASEKRQDKKIAEFVEETLEKYFHHFDSFLFEALDAIGKGVSIGEIIFGEAGDRIYIENVKFKPQHLFSFGETAFANYSTASMMYPQTGPLQLRTGVSIDAALGGKLPEDKFFVFSFRPKHGNRWGDPVNRKGFWWDWVLRASLRNWLKYQEKGSGVVIAKYPGSSGEKEQNDALSAATAVMEETAVAIPDKFELEVHEMVRNIGSSHKELVDDYCTSQLTKIYLGQTLTSRGSDGGGSRALGEVHERVSDKISETDCKALMQAINDDIIRPLVRLNFGPDAALPTYLIEYEPTEDLDSKAKRYAVAHKDIGIDLSKQQIRDDLQLEEPRDEEDTLAAATAPNMPVEGDVLDDSEISEFAEKKKGLHGSGTPSNLRTARFRKLRPSMINFSNE